MVTWGGFEPPIFSLGVRCSIQLSYQVKFLTITLYPDDNKRSIYRRQI